MTSPTPRGVLLLIEDDVDHAFLVRRQLRDHWGLNLLIEQAGSAGAAAERLVRSGDVRCVVLDLSLPDAKGMQAFDMIREAAPDVPVVVLTGLDSDEMGLLAVQRGAQDYLVKGRHDSGTVGRAVLFAIERAGRQRAEREQLHLSGQLELLLDASAEGICWLDVDGVCTFINRAAAEIIGWGTTEVRGHLLHDVTHLCDEAPCSLSLAMIGSRDVDAGEHNFRRRDGSLRLVEVRIRSVLGVDGRGDGVVMNFTDVTERRRAQIALAEREAQLVDAQRIARLGSWEWDTTTGEVLWSDELYQLTGLLPDTVPADSTAFDLYLSLVDEADQDMTGSLFRVPTAGSAPRVVRHRLCRPDGSPRWLQGHTSAVADHGTASTRIVGTVQDITEQKGAEEALAFQALHDPLTGLPNRNLLRRRLEQGLDSACGDRALVGVVFLDLDRFKWVNDSFSHHAGDQLLVAVAQRLSEVLRPTDTLARLGGDEFVVLCLGLPSESVLLSLAERLREALERPFSVNGSQLTVTASMGIALAAADGAGDADLLLQNADTAMYRAKEKGRSRLEVFDDDMRQRASQRLQTQNELRLALQREEFVVAYQPLVSLADGRVTGTEALVRWRHPARGLLSPIEFIGHAEETGLIVELGEVVLELACAQTAAWNRVRDPASPLDVAVNISARQLTSDRLLDTVSRVLSETGLDARLLCLEITETVLMEDVTTSGAVLGQLRELGVRIAVDDFGTGYSSLAYLRSLPVDLLKIDRSFIGALERGEADMAIVRAVAALAQALRLEVVAEGVETAAQLRAVVALGVHVGQGYLWTPPIIEAEATWAEIEAVFPASLAPTQADGACPALPPQRVGITVGALLCAAPAEFQGMAVRR